VLRKGAILATLGLLIGGTIFFSVIVIAQEELIPNWLKTSAKFWIEGQTSDREFLDSLQYLFDKGILTMPTDEAEHVQIETKTLHRLEGYEAIDKINEIKKFSFELTDKEITLRKIAEPQESIYYLAIHPYSIEWRGSIGTSNLTDSKDIQIEGKVPVLISFECWDFWHAYVETSLAMFEPSVKSPSVLVEVFKNDIRLDGERAGYNISWVSLRGKC